MKICKLRTKKFITLAPEVEVEHREKIFASLAFMKCSKFYPKKSPDVTVDERKLDESLSESSASQPIMANLRQQSHMEKSKCDGIDDEPRVLEENVFVWLDPIQKKALVSML
jgi:hypothetical protein